MAESAGNAFLTQVEPLAGPTAEIINLGGAASPYAPVPTPKVQLPTVAEIKVKEYIKVKLPPDEEELVTSTLTLLQQDGWQYASFCRDLRSRLRPMEPGELPDIPEQRYIWEVDPPQPDLSVSDRKVHSTFAKRSYEALEPSLKTKYDEQVQEYVDNQWWTEIPPTERTDALSKGITASVFLVIGKKPRLVIDFRKMNTLIGDGVSADQKAISLTIANLRLQGPSSIAVVDAQAAFYKSRFFPGCVNLQLCTHNKLYRSNRPCFGVSYGPASLSATLGRHVTFCQTHGIMTEGTLVTMFVDDLAAGSGQHQVAGNIARTASTLLPAGHNWPLDKASIGALDPLVVQPMLDEYGINVTAVNHTSVLGSSFTFTHLEPGDIVLDKIPPIPELVPGEEKLKIDLVRPEDYPKCAALPVLSYCSRVPR
jgi:hypothetical protein